MTRLTGHDLALCWAYTGGSVWLEADFREFNYSGDVNDADATAGDDTTAVHLPTYSDGELSLNMVGTVSMGTAHYAALASRTQGTVYWYGEGTASGKPKAQQPAYISKFEETWPYDDVVEQDITWQSQGDITRGTA